MLTTSYPVAGAPTGSTTPAPAQPAQMPARRLASLSLCHDWPARLRALHRSAVLAWELCGILESEAMDMDYRDRPLADAACTAYRTWRDIELAAAPILAAYEQSEARL